MKQKVVEVTRTITIGSKTMDSNYEAQKQFTRQRLAARREQAAAERILKEGRSPRTGGFKHFLVKLFRRSDRREEKKQEQKSRKFGWR
ncbi:MAG: hypothetical protein ACK2U5_19175 [Candidatus Promineifilaceae bacterium]|jgi:hypothetical protein